MHAADTKDTSPQDFAYGAKVLSSGPAAAYRAALPLTVYQKVVHGDLGDVRVFNERNELVPHRIERPTSQSTVQPAGVSLPVFPLQNDSPEALNAIRLTIEAAGARIDASIPVEPTARSVTSGNAFSPVASYVLDGRLLNSPVAAFNLSWPDNAPDFAGRLRIESSDDLGTWRTVVPAAPIANLHAGNARIVERRVDVPNAAAKFWRLSWSDKPAPFAITSVVAEPSRDRVDVMRAALAASGASDPNKPGEFTFDLGAQVPVDRVNLELPEQNSIVEVELYSRDRPTSQWRFATRSGFYRLRGTFEANTDLTNGPIPIELRSDRYWLARVDVRNGGLGRNAPTLRVGWLPHDIVFLARGAGPFTLAYGNVSAHASPALGAIPESVSIAEATLAEPQTLGGDVRLGPVLRPLKWWSMTTALWTVLAIGVALLAFMAYRLANELKDRP